MILNSESKVLIQGIAEPQGTTHAAFMTAYGTNIVAGVHPGKGGQTLHEIPVFDMVEQAIAQVGELHTSVIFVSPFEAVDAALEAIAAGIRQLVLVTEGIPPLDMVRLIRQAEVTETSIVGPSSPGIIIPGNILLGTHPAEFYTPGNIGIISRSDTLTYEIAGELSRQKMGQSIGIGIGSDTIVGSSFHQWLQILDEDDRTEAIILIGEIGGTSEESAAQYIRDTIDKPVVAYIAGRCAPQGKTIGHAGAAIAAQTTSSDPYVNFFPDANSGTADTKLAAFQQAEIPVAETPSQIPSLVKKVRKKGGRRNK